ncbi:porphobilinogen synthase [Cellulomonas sp. P4]|uniref:porphobilinogen synthase n=1 Tax=Cellulomonas sp. P4 TaxID=3142533 RepID=UPI0031BB98D3
MTSLDDHGGSTPGSTGTAGTPGTPGTPGSAGTTGATPPGTVPAGAPEAVVAAARPGRVRPRRLRATTAMRRSVSQTRLHPAELVLPLFVKEGLAEPQPIASMPGVVQHTRDSLRRAVVEAAAAGVGGVNLFGVPLARDAVGSGATDPDGILNVALADVRAEVGDALVIQADLCLDEFTDHGHCGVLTPDGVVDNDATLVRYAEMALAQADAGAHMVAPSGMMDGQVGVIRDVLDAAGRTDVAVLAYAAKYASVLYGPFRDAVESTLDGDRRTYQMDPGNRREALHEVALDIAEGADVVMVKPAGAYLDVLADVAAASTVPVAAYQVSGEYAMVEAAAAQGWLDRRRAITESVLGIRRAGADQVLTYWAVELAHWLREEWR